MISLEKCEQNRAKKAAAEAAVDLIQDGMRVGLGTGSTSACFIKALAKKCKEGMQITAVATSLASENFARELGIPTVNIESVEGLDVTVDGADELDPSWNMIKGGGGALFREKLLAMSSQEMIVIVDESKCIAHLGKHPLPVEILPFGYTTTIRRMNGRGFFGFLRKNVSQVPFITDNGNYIYDICLDTPLLEPQKMHAELKEITGVLETGLFFNIAKRVVIGYKNGSTRILPP